MNEITSEELEDAKVKNGKIENACMFIAKDYNPKHYFRMVVPHHSNKANSRRFSLFSDDGIWFFLPNAHPKAREINGREVWNCDLIYRGYGWTDDDEGNRIKLEWQIGAFMVAPLSHLEMPKKLNKSAAQRANKAGYEVIITDW